MAIELVDKIKQKNGLKFKLLDAIDIETTFLDGEGNTRDLEDVLKDLFEKIREGLGGGSGSDGKDGIGIESIAKTSTSGLVDTYTITLTDGNTTTFTVTNGRDGVNGADGTNGKDGVDGTNGADGVGIEDIVKTSTDGLVDTYTITLSDGTEKTFTVTNGTGGEITDEQVENAVGNYFEKNPVVKSEVEKYMQENPVKDGVDGKDGVNGTDGTDGTDGVGVSSIEKTATEGLVDTYTITLTNGNTSTFEVTNGRNGVDGKDGVNGTDGRDGVVTEEQNEKLNAIGNVEILTQNGFSDVISALFSLKEIIDNMVSIGEMKDNVITLLNVESGEYTFRYEDSNGDILEDFEIFSGKNEDYSLGVS